MADLDGLAEVYTDDKGAGATEVEAVEAWAAPLGSFFDLRRAERSHAKLGGKPREPQGGMEDHHVGFDSSALRDVMASHVRLSR